MPEWGGPIDKLHYPIRFYDVLGALLVMTEMGMVRDRRCNDALDLLEAKCIEDGTFPAEWTNLKRADQIESRGTYADWDPIGKRKDNPFVTVDALHVLREAGRGWNDRQEDQVTRQKSPTRAETDAVAAYIDAAAEPARSRLATLRSLVREEAPDAVERMAYGLPTWHQGENLLHLGAFAHHVGLYPGPAAIEAFADELESFSTSKGAIQLPHVRDLPIDLIRRIVRWRLTQVSGKRPPPAPNDE